MASSPHPPPPFPLCCTHVWISTRMVKTGRRRGRSICKNRNSYHFLRNNWGQVLLSEVQQERGYFIFWCNISPLFLLMFLIPGLLLGCCWFCLVNDQRSSRRNSGPSLKITIPTTTGWVRSGQAQSWPCAGSQQCSWWSCSYKWTRVPCLVKTRTWTSITFLYQFWCLEFWLTFLLVWLTSISVHSTGK